jgi:hypothetical protein
MKNTGKTTDYPFVKEKQWSEIKPGRFNSLSSENNGRLK